jgi:hypothetical protein
MDNRSCSGYIFGLLQSHIKLFESRPLNPVFNLADIFSDSTYDLERQFVRAGGRKCPIIALGKPGEAIGVGRILTDDASWRKLITTLIEKAQIILCVPSTRSGTRWELDYIVDNNHTRKTVFIMPPESPGFSIWSKKADFSKEWLDVQSYMRDHKLVAPDYVKSGQLFKVRSLSEPGSEPRCTTYPMDLGNYKSIRQAVYKLRGAIDPYATRERIRKYVIRIAAAVCCLLILGKCLSEY